MMTVKMYRGLKDLRAEAIARANAYLREQADKVVTDEHDPIELFVERVATHAREIEALDDRCAAARASLELQGVDPTGYHAAVMEREGA